MKMYHQHAVIEKLNLYLTLKKRSLQLKSGYCHGFTLLWLYSMSTHTEDWFYKTIKGIVDSESKKNFAAIELDIEKFIAHIEWFQHPNKYVDDINQLDVDQLMDIPREFSLSFLFKNHSLTDYLKKIIQNEKMTCISGPNHTIGVYRRGNQYYLFDSNNNKGEAKIFADVYNLKLEIVQSLFGDVNPTKLLPLEFNVISDLMNKDNAINKNDILESLIQSSSQIDKAGYAGITNLFLACESGDENEVEQLLAQGADVNQACYDGWTPLMVAANNGYSNVVKTLIEKKIDLNSINRDKSSALDLAIINNHDRVAKLLLRQGASPTLKTENDESPIHRALKNQHWSLVTFLLKFVHRFEYINAQDLKLLRQHKQEVVDEFNKCWPSLSEDERNHIQWLTDKLFKRTFEPRFFDTKPISKDDHYQISYDSPSFQRY